MSRAYLRLILEENSEVLQLIDMHFFYGLSHILQGVFIEVRQGEVVCLLGRNGVGKTTTLKSIMGYLMPRAGKIIFKGGNIVGLPPHSIARLGISYVPENRRLFPSLTVRENLLLGLSSARRGENKQKGDKINFIFRSFPVLRERFNQMAQTLSGGEQQMLALARGLMGGPEFLLLDEPSQGLAPAVVREIKEIIDDLRKRGITILLVEQNAKLALRVSDRGYIMEKGQVCFQGTSRELQESHVTREKLGV